MQGWMIALIIVASVVFLLLLTFAISVIIVMRAVLGRRNNPMKNEIPEKYSVDLSWFDDVKDNTTMLELTSYDGLKLSGMLITHGDASVRRVAVCQHGYCATSRTMQPYAKLFFDKGYDVLLPSARAHGDSEGKYIGMAWLDRFDLMRWLELVVSRYGDDVKIVLMGVSMGGATTVAVSGMNPPPQLRCIVDDCGFSSQYDEYSSCVASVHLPKKLTLLPLAVGVKLCCGYSLYDADIVPFAQKSSLPALFIHGEKDGFVPITLGRKLYDAYACSDKEFYAVENALHAASYSTDKEGYAAKLMSFVDKNIGE